MHPHDDRYCSCQVKRQIDEVHIQGNETKLRVMNVRQGTFPTRKAETTHPGSTELRSTETFCHEGNLGQGVCSTPVSQRACSRDAGDDGLPGGVGHGHESKHI
jgi:hypothetical protein